MREALINTTCLDFIDSADQRFRLKFLQVIEVLIEVPLANSHFVKKLAGTEYYELRIRANQEYRIIVKTLDSADFNQCRKFICLVGFLKKSTKDYRNALRRANTVLNNWQENGY